MAATGLDADLQMANDERYKQIAGIEGEMVQWIEAITGESKGEQTVADWLHSGIVLCNLANKIQPGCIKKVNDSTMPFKQMENITKFMDAARAAGVPESSMFGTPDLYEAKNMVSVVSCIHSYGGAIQIACPDFGGPKLGVALTHQSADNKRASVAVTQTGGLSGALGTERPADQIGYVRPVGGTNIAGVASIPERHVEQAISTDSAVKTGPRNDDCTYGLDADLKKKQEEKYDHSLEAEVVEWIQTITGESKGEVSVGEWLHDGSVLCALANKVHPGSIKKVNTSKLAFKQMENITFFMDAMRASGVPETCMFGTPDLYEEKNMGSVMSAIESYGGAVQVIYPEFDGPKLGVAVHHKAAKGDAKREGKMATQGGGLAGTLEHTVEAAGHERAAFTKPE